MDAKHTSHKGVLITMQCKRRKNTLLLERTKKETLQEQAEAIAKAIANNK